jgi:cell division protein FtsB
MSSQHDLAAGAVEPADAPPSRRRRWVPVQERRDRRRTIITCALSIALCGLVVNAVVGENGFLAAARARREKIALEVDVARIRLENAELQRESHRLQTDPAALDEAAHGLLGMIRPGETLVILHDAKPAGR